MTEPRCPFVDPHAVFDQFVIKRPGDTVDQFFVRNARRDDPYIYASFCGKSHCMCHLIGNDQIWCHKPAVFFCLVHHADVNFFSHLFAIQWAVRIWLNKSSLLCFIRIFQQKPGKIRVILILVVNCIPHLKESHCQRTHRIALQTDARILPLSVRVCQIEIFIRKVISACKSDFAVDHGDLSVITVVQKQIQTWHKRIKYTTADSDCFHLFGKVCINKTNRAHIVIEYPDLHTCLYTVFQHLLNPVPGLGILNCMVFHKDKLLRFGQILKLCFQSLCRLIKIGHICILIHRIPSISVDIGRNISGSWNFLQ